MSWFTDENVTMNTADYIGFVYKITELDTGKFYIGQKKYWRIKKLQPLKGKKNKRHFKVETDWKTYNSSNKELQEKIEKNPNNYYKSIIFSARNQTELSVHETYYQLQEYFNGNWDKCYNEMINLRVRIRKS